MQDQLTDDFIVPPFSVLDASQGYWRSRQQLWKSMGINSQDGREENLTYRAGDDDFLSKQMGELGGTSVFDPVLCEILYRWFTPNTGRILDPFCGGSVRGIVAGKTGRSYVGVDVRREQIEENNRQLAGVCPEADVRYVEGDSLELPTLLDPSQSFDFVFSCPPYGDLEVYSEDPRDISNKSHEDFVKAYRLIIANAVDRLTNNRFACFVVGDYRVKNGALFDFTNETVKAFEDAGCKLYNKFVFVVPVGTLRLRVRRQFNSSRKCGARSQFALVFLKGDAKKAVEAIGKIDPTYPGGVFAGGEGNGILDFF